MSDLYKDRYRKPRSPIVIPERCAERAATKWEADGGCLISTYSVSSSGYAQIGWHDGESRHVTTAHRAAWVYHNQRQIPAGYTVDHMCKRKTCVNPDHLRALPNYENARRTHGDDWPVGTCKHGHPNSDLEIIGDRVECRPCSTERGRRRRERDRLAAAA